MTPGGPWTISVKLVTAFVAISLVAGVVGLVARARFQAAELDLLQLADAHHEAVDRARIKEEVLRRELTFLEYMHTGKQTALSTHMVQSNDIVRRLDEVTEDAEEGPEKNGLRELLADEERYAALANRVVHLIGEGKAERARKLGDEEVLPAVDEMLGGLQASIELEADEINELAARSLATAYDSEKTMLALAGFGVAAALCLSLLLARGIASPLREAVAVAERIARGDLRETVRVRERDETGRLLRAHQLMAESLVRVVRNVRGSARTLAEASDRLAASAGLLSQGTSEQARFVEEITANLETMSKLISQNADSARESEQIALKAAKEVEEAGESFQETVGAMRSIANKVSIIDAIASDTNLLALKATSEAARAGEHGNGFAGVATEANRLAELGQTAAQEVGELAGRSVENAECAGEVFGALLPLMRRTAYLVQAVAGASREQSTGVDRISSAMSRVDQVTQRNAASAETLAQTAQGFSEQAVSLRELIGFFQLADDAAPQPLSASPSG